MGGQRHALAVFSSGKDPVPIVQEAGWAPGLVWISAENLAFTGIRSLTMTSSVAAHTHCPGHQAVTVTHISCTKHCVPLLRQHICTVQPTKLSLSYALTLGEYSAVGIATHYRLDSPGIESRLGRDFLHPSRPALGPTQPPIQWVSGLSQW